LGIAHWVLPAGVPALRGAARVFPTQIQFQLTGAAGLNYTIQASLGLQGTNDLQGHYVVTDWFKVQVTNAPADSFLIVDPKATNTLRRFYRAVVGP
jgi:hypothetical protein